jgi:hypothetical protein
MEKQEEQTHRNLPGRPRKVESPDQLVSWFEEYVEETKSHPFKIKDWVGKDGKEVSREKEKPLTMVGFENYCAKKGYINDLKDYFANDRESYGEFQNVCQNIRNIILQDHIEGGMAGIYNHSLTARINGLVEKTENNNTNVNKNYDITLDLGASTPNEDKV